MTVKYRRDIDGLRAVAVVPVVLLHTGYSVFSGGFVGVDVFFVISGFLITSIILPDIEANRFSAVGFYDRRVRRLFPALVMVLAGTTALSMIVLTPRELVSYGRSLAATAGFVSNIYFWRDSGYFGPAGVERPLLHTWSLAVEEQFYLLFPIALLLVVRRAGRRGAYAGLALLGGASLVLAEYGVRRGYAATFFLLPTRGWELLLGALIAVPLIPPPRKWVAQAIAAIGLVLIVVAIVAYSPLTPFPGVSAIPPCLGAALLLYSGRDHSDTIVAQLLGVTPAVIVGRISYSLYLWHWPLLTVAALYLTRPLTTVETCIVVAVAFVLAALSWKYVEVPLRRPTTLRANPRLRVSLGIGSMAVVFLAGILLVLARGFPSRVPSVVLAADSAYADGNPLRSACTSMRDGLPPVAPCLVGPSAGKGTYQVIVWGDSHADHYFPAIVEALKQRRLTARQIVRSSCPPLLDARVSRLVDPSPAFAENCAVFNASVLKVTRETSGVQLVVLAGAWTNFSEQAGLVGSEPFPSVGTSRRILAVSLTRTVRAITDLGISVLLMGQAPEFASSPASCLARAAMFRRDVNPCILTDSAGSAQKTHYADGLIAELVRSNPQVGAFFPAKVMCAARTCSAFKDGVIFYRDWHHLSASGARVLGRAIDLPPDVRTVQPSSTKLEASRHE